VGSLFRDCYINELACDSQGYVPATSKYRLMKKMMAASVVLAAMSGFCAKAHAEPWRECVVGPEGRWVGDQQLPAINPFEVIVALPVPEEGANDPFGWLELDVDHTQEQDNSVYFNDNFLANLPRHFEYIPPDPYEPIHVVLPIPLEFFAADGNNTLRFNAVEFHTLEGSPHLDDFHLADVCISSVPEPFTFTLVVLGAIPLLFYARRRGGVVGDSARVRR